MSKKNIWSSVRKIEELFYAGLSDEEIAQKLGNISKKTVQRYRLYYGLYRNQPKDFYWRPAQISNLYDAASKAFNGYQFEDIEDPDVDRHGRVSISALGLLTQSSLLN